MKFFRYLEYMFKMPLKIHKIYDEVRDLRQVLNTLISAQMMANIHNPNVILELQRSSSNKPRRIYNLSNALKYLSLVNPVRSPSLELIRIGGFRDGGYCLHCPPPVKNILPKVLSLGVSENSPFDLEMANRGYEVLEYDGSIDASPYPYHPSIKFFKKFVGGVDSENTISLKSILIQHHFDTNVHNILQCDIEDAEWEMLENIEIEVLAKYFSQMIFEFHHCEPDDEKLSIRRWEILSKIREYFTPIHTHFNHSWGLLFAENLFFAPLIEVSYLRKDLVPNDAILQKGTATLPHIDCPNNPYYADIPVYFNEKL